MGNTGAISKESAPPEEKSGGGKASPEQRPDFISNAIGAIGAVATFVFEIWKFSSPLKLALGCLLSVSLGFVIANAITAWPVIRQYKVMLTSAVVAFASLGALAVVVPSASANNPPHSPSSTTLSPAPRWDPSAAVDKALLVEVDIASTFGHMAHIDPVPGSDHQCQPGGEPSQLATAQAWFGTDGIQYYQAAKQRNESYSNVVEAVNAYRTGDISMLVQFVNQYKLALNNCTDSSQGTPVTYSVISQAPPLCNQSFIAKTDASGPTGKYEAFIRCGNLLASVVVLQGRNSQIKQGDIYKLFEAAAIKLHGAEQG